MRPAVVMATRSAAGPEPAGSAAVVLEIDDVSKIYPGGTQALKSDWRRPSDAQHAGVAVVYQQSPVSPALSVLENVYLGAGTGAVWNVALRRADLAALCASIGFEIDPGRPVAELSIGDRQISDTVSVLRDGRLVDSFDAAGMSRNRMISGIVGSRLRAVEDAAPPVTLELGDEVLAVRCPTNCSPGSEPWPWATPWSLRR